MNEQSPIPPAAESFTLEQAIEAIRELRTVVEYQGRAIVQLNDNLGVVARTAKMIVVNDREKLDG